MNDPKLIRDFIPTIIAATGRGCETRLLDEGAFESALRDKLVEEAYELRAAPLPDLATEIADVLEVVDALLELHGLSLESVRAIQKERRLERGGFAGRLQLIRIYDSTPTGSIKDQS